VSGLSKRVLALAAGVFGVRALVRRRRRAAPPVDELRAKLAESRTAAEPPAPPAPEPEPVDEVDSRRAEVHERVRRSIDELSS
jgi:hypothetical protein